MIYLHSSARAADVNGRQLKEKTTMLLQAVGEPDAGLSILLVDDEEIRRLNREHRGKDKATDVLSFALAPAAGGSRDGPERLLGDVVISVESARRQAADYDAPLQNELYRLLIHGVLHVLGYDHEKPDERKAMIAQERRLAETIGMPWPYE